LRVHDENMPPPAVLKDNTAGKTLHQRTKSVPAFSTLYQADAARATNKRVLGEANTNIRIAQAAKDDTALGKKGASGPTELMKPAVALARPATRPVQSKSFSSQSSNSSTSTATIKAAPLATKQSNLHLVSEVAAELPKKLVIKKSTKVLKEAQPAEQGVQSIATVAPVHQPIPQTRQAVPTLLPEFQGGVPVQHQEVHKTEIVPLRDEPAPRQVPSLPSNVPSGFVSEQEYLLYLDADAKRLRMSNGSYGQPQYYDEDEEEYYYEEGYTTNRSFGLQAESTGGVTTVIAPKTKEKDVLELANAKAFVDSTRTPEDVEDEAWDTSMVAEYGDEIFGYMKELEIRMAPNPRYMDQQQEIQWSMRAVLIDWVVQVHQRFNLLPETLFLTINYIDRFLSCKIVSLGKLQLVGATALFVAAKYEEVNCPTIQEIIYMVDGGYSADELLKAERFMLSMLQFELGWPGPMSFLRRISKADDYDLETRTLAKYFLEITVMDERFIGCTPSFLAAGAHCMARLMLRKGDWGLAHVHYSTYTYSQLRQLLNTMLECCEEPRKHHMAVFDKYTDKRFKRASTYVEAEMGKGFQLPKFTRQSSLSPVEANMGGYFK